MFKLYVVVRVSLKLRAKSKTIKLDKKIRKLESQSVGAERCGNYPGCG